MNQSHHPVPIMVCIGMVSGNSAVYIAERNVVLGVSSHSKTNNGFGSIDSNNILRGNLNLVYDCDVVDTPIDDRDVKIFQNNHHPSDSKVTQVAFGSINVATMTQNSGVFVGDVQITGLDAHTKQNMSQGSTYGNSNIETHNFNYLHDSDVMDTPIQDQDFKVLLR